MTDTTKHDALRDLFTEERFMRRLARSLVHDASTADDLVQQAFLRALEATPRSIRQPRAWLGQVIRRLAIEGRRSDARRSNRERVAAKAEAVGSPDNLVSLEEQRHRLGMAVTELPEPYRSTVLRHYRAGWNYGRIARHDGVKREAVESRIRRAKAMLRTKLGATSEEGPQAWALALVPLASGMGIPAKAASVSAAPQLAVKAGLVATVLALGLLAILSALPNDEGAEPVEAKRIAAEPARAAAPLPTPHGEAVRVARTDDRPAPITAEPTMPGLARVSGRLVRPGGSPIPETAIGLLTIEMETPFPLRARSGSWAGLGLERTTTRTDARGAFTFEHVTPGARHALDVRAAGGDEQLRVIQQSASPEQHLDLGTITIAVGPIWTGRVIDHAGQPVEGATVRTGHDLDMALLTRLPLHRFDPDGGFVNGFARATEGIVQGSDWEPWFDNLRLEFSATLSDRPEGPRAHMMLESPPWLDQLAAHLPLPTATTDADGRFEMTGVRAGSQLVMVATPTGDKKVWRIDVRPGTPRVLKLPEPTEFATQIVDGHGKAIAGATVCVSRAYRRVLCATRTTTRWVTTDASGRTRVRGIEFFDEPTDRVTVAARRRVGHPWYFWPTASAAQQSRLEWPAATALKFRVETEPGATFDPRHLALVQGPPLGNAIDFGIQPELDLTSLMHRTGDGRFTIDSLVPGFYTLVYRAPDAAPIAVGVPVDSTERDLPVLRIRSRVRRSILVTNAAGHPVAGALVRAQPVRSEAWNAEHVARLLRGSELPKRKLRQSKDTWSALSPTADATWRTAGRTDASGQIATELDGAGSRIVATHPQFGTGSTEVAEAGAESGIIRVQLTAYAHVHGRVTERGKLPTKPHVLTLDPDRDPQRTTNDARRALVTPMATDGTFRFPPVVPGRYRLVLRPKTAAQTPFAAMLAASFPGYASRWSKRHPSARVQVESLSIAPGSTHDVQLETDPGAASRGLDYSEVSGRVTIDSRVAAGCLVNAEEQVPWHARKIANRREVRTDARGRYHLRELCPGNWKLTFELDGVRLATDTMMIPATRSSMPYDVDITTGSLVVRVLDRNGAPAPQTKIGCRTKTGRVGTSATTGPDGSVRLQLPAGTYTAFLRGAKGRQTGVVVQSGESAATTIRTQPTTELLLRFSGKKLASGFSLHREGSDYTVIHERKDPLTRIGPSEAGWYHIEAHGRLRITPDRFEVRTDRPRTEIALTVTESR